jgi:hypothetical protein
LRAHLLLSEDFAGNYMLGNSVVISATFSGQMTGNSPPRKTLARKLLKLDEQISHFRAANDGVTSLAIGGPRGFGG